MPACRLLRSCALPEEAFADEAALAARLHDLRAGRPIVLKRCVVTLPGDAGRQAICVHFAEDRETIGYAIVGDPPLAAGVQYDRLGGALAALCREAA